MTQLMHPFESVLTGDRETVTTTALKIQQMESEIEQMKFQSELSIRNIETASTSCMEELKNTITGLQHEVAIRKGQR